MSRAPVDVPNPRTPEEPDDEEMPRVQMTRRRFVLGVTLIVVVVAILYYGIPRLAGLNDTWHRIEQGDPWWLALAAGFTVLSFAGYVVLFEYVFAEDGARLGLRESYQVTMASLAATRIFAAGGAGGIALTAWAMRRYGMDRRTVADRTIVFLVLTYVVYMVTMLLVGVGLRLELLPGPAPFGMTVVPAAFAGIAIALTLLLSLTPTDLQRRMDSFSWRGGRVARFVRRAATLPASLSAGVRHSIGLVRTRNPAVLGSVAYWGFNIAVLWAAFRAFGEAPPWPVIVQAYFVGMLGNLLPLPGGVGGVDGGMIGAFIAFGVDGGLAVVAVLTYRAFAFWLPTIPGAIAFFQLRRTVARWREERERGRATAAPARA
ncbi:MAG TPA: lysylphosphatidylglycerol synthase transmembrane domain-containing protein [Solirubrobacteraceae bacterium]|nr:lysylphosphatidylglycerol synthase transmembrane domain-containing protein [Solirubrobacteraceae bacterium]